MMIIIKISQITDRISRARRDSALTVLLTLLKQFLSLPQPLPCSPTTCTLVKLEATVRTGHGTTDWFQIGKGVRQGCILSPCLFK